MIFKILWLFVNTLTADEKYYVVNGENLTQDIQMALSKNQKYFSEMFSASSKFRLILEHFQSNDDPQRWFCFRITDSEIRG